MLTLVEVEDDTLDERAKLGDWSNVCSQNQAEVWTNAHLPSRHPSSMGERNFPLKQSF